MNAPYVPVVMRRQTCIGGREHRSVNPDLEVDVAFGERSRHRSTADVLDVRAGEQVPQHSRLLLEQERGAGTHLGFADKSHCFVLSSFSRTQAASISERHAR